MVIFLLYQETFQVEIINAKIVTNNQEYKNIQTQLVRIYLI